MKFVRLPSRSTECLAFRCWLQWLMASCLSPRSSTFCTATFWLRFLYESAGFTRARLVPLSWLIKNNFLFQPIPVLFRTARSILITGLYIVYTAYKCIVVIYLSWKTKIDSQKTGIQLHKIANVVDENHFYNVCNHLSLKLLNHHLNFTACGFFDLDMTTIYAISGAITSYLIILIQFNLAAIRAKPMNATTPNNGTNYSNVVGTTILPVKLSTISP